MLKFYDLPRGSGKTTRIEEEMKLDKNAIVIVPTRANKSDSSAEERTYTVREVLHGSLDSVSFSQIFIDELFLSEYEKMALLWKLGGYKKDVSVYHTSSMALTAHLKEVESLGWEKADTLYKKYRHVISFQ